MGLAVACGAIVVFFQRMTPVGITKPSANGSALDTIIAAAKAKRRTVTVRRVRRLPVEELTPYLLPVPDPPAEPWLGS